MKCISMLLLSYHAKLSLALAIAIYHFAARSFLFIFDWHAQDEKNYSYQASQNLMVLAIYMYIMFKC